MENHTESAIEDIKKYIEWCHEAKMVLDSFGVSRDDFRYYRESKREVASLAAKYKSEKAKLEDFVEATFGSRERMMEIAKTMDEIKMNMLGERDLDISDRL